MHIEISLATKFHLKLTLLDQTFWIKLTQKGYFRTKKKENYHRILHIEINLDSKFQFSTILIFETNFQKKSILPVKIRRKTNITIEFFIFTC